MSRDDTLSDGIPTSAYDVDPATAHKAALTVCHHLGHNAGPTLDMLGLRYCPPIKHPKPPRDRNGRAIDTRPNHRKQA